MITEQGKYLILMAGCVLMPLAQAFALASYA